MSREMKESGIDWIGSIPKSWNTIKFKYLHGGMNTGEGIDKNFWSNEPTDRLFYTAGINPIRTNYEDFPEWKYTKENDLLLARNGTPYIYIPHPNACYTDHIIRATMNASVNKRFVQYGLQCSIASVVVDSVSLATWSASLWNKQVIAWPSAEEQERIVSFLDEKCAHIDSVLEKTRNSIEEYKKLKQAVITQAVTKGIKNDCRVKSSKIEWIDKIPEKWKEIRIKNIFDFREEKNYIPLEEVNLLSLYTDLGVIQHSDLEKTVGNKAVNADGYKKVYENDIIVNIILCWMGAIGISKYDGVTSPAYDVYCPRENVDSKFYHYYFRTTGFASDCYKRGRGIMAMRWRTYSDQFRDIKVVYPPLREQKEIVQYLDEKCNQIENLVKKKKKFIEELEFYKKSLIYEYVTGKKEVPEF